MKKYWDIYDLLFHAERGNVLVGKKDLDRVTKDVDYVSFGYTEKDDKVLIVEVNWFPNIMAMNAIR